MRREDLIICYADEIRSIAATLKNFYYSADGMCGEAGSVILTVFYALDGLAAGLEGEANDDE